MFTSTLQAPCIADCLDMNEKLSKFLRILVRAKHLRIGTESVKLYIIFWFINSNENNFIYLLYTSERKKWILIEIVYWTSSSRLRSFVIKSKGECKWRNSENISVSQNKMA